MPTPTESAPPPLARACRWLRLGVVVFVLAMVAWRWDARTGFTALIRFGDDFAGRRLPEVAGLAVAGVPGAGYDGQFYAQLAVNPNFRAPEVQAALDNPPYRVRRIGLSLLAHVLGAGSPWATLQVYALLNTAVWLAFAWLCWREIGAATPHATLRWCAVVLALGALDSVRLSLTDLPATLLVLLAARYARKAKPLAAAAWLLAAGFARETAILACPLFWDGDWRSRKSWLRFLLASAACAAPLLLWALWLHFTLVGQSGGNGNLLLPGQGLVQHLAECYGAFAEGNFDSRYVWGLIGAAALGLQSVSMLLRWREPSLWIRLALPFALLYWCLGPSVWHSYWTAARALLPLTLAFNLTLPSGRGFWWRFALGNACALHAIYRLLPDL
jgi:hypothetical protein